MVCSVAEGAEKIIWAHSRGKKNCFTLKNMCVLKMLRFTGTAHPSDGNHLEERLLDQAQARASFPPPF